MKENSYSFRSENLFFTTNKDRPRLEIFRPTKAKNLGNNKINGFSEYLNQFWNRLVAKPESFPQQPSSCISEILAEEKRISANEMIAKVLSDKLKLAQDSEEVLKAVKESTQIFHEDFPGDFILEYNGTRLGLFLLDVCYDSGSNAVPIYRFRPNLKSFNGLY